MQKLPACWKSSRILKYITLEVFLEGRLKFLPRFCKTCAAKAECIIKHAKNIRGKRGNVPHVGSLGFPLFVYKYPCQHLCLKNMWPYLCLRNVIFWRSKVEASDVLLDPSSLFNTGTKSPPSTAPSCPEFLKILPLFIRMLLSPPWLSGSCLSGWFLMLLLHVAPSLGILKVCTLDDVCCRRPPLLWTTAATIRGPVGFFSGPIFHNYTVTLASNASLCVLTSPCKPSQLSDIDTGLLLLDFPSHHHYCSISAI